MDSSTKSFFSISPEEKKILIIPLIIFSVLILIEIIIILILNSGLFVYTVDDSYIHLALAENIFKGHYGVNLQENSSPSSSILWTFLLVPFSGFSFGYLIPLIINICSTAGIIFIYFLIVKITFLPSPSENKKPDKILVLFIIALVVLTNLITLTFSGMEHSLQTFFTALIIYGLIYEIKFKEISKWLIIAIVLAPLIRYENLVLSFASLLFIYLRGYKKTASLTFIIIILTMGGFSIFLLNLGLEPLPMSVFGKSKIISSGGSLDSILKNLKANIVNPRCILLIIGMMLLIYKLFSNINKEERWLAGTIAFAILVHLLAGKHGRYIVYIWTASVLTILFLYKNIMIKFVTKNKLSKVTVITVLFIVSLSYSYIFGTLVIPIGSNNIYEQQYQMHRFATEYYKEPLAVNDLGYVAYRNDIFILDLEGLGSMDVQKERRKDRTPGWMNKTALAHNVKFAMIYDEWYKNLPGNWHKVAELYLGKIKEAPAENVVSFYILNNNIKDDIIFSLNDFKKTLPGGVKLKIFY